MQRHSSAAASSRQLSRRKTGQLAAWLGKYADLLVPIALLATVVWISACEGALLGPASNGGAATAMPAQGLPGANAGVAHGGNTPAAPGVSAASGGGLAALAGAPAGGGTAQGDTSAGGPASGGGQLNAGGGGSGGASAGGPMVSGTVPAKQNLRVALIGDSANGQDFKDVLRLIKSENADLVIHEGDFDYDVNPDAFFATVDQELGASYPYFAAVGNHDAPAWEGYVKHLKSHLDKNQVTLDDPDMLDEKYAFDYMGLKLVFVGQNGKNAEFADYIEQQFSNDDHVWRLCNWHKNQKAMQIGGKSDEAGWDVYERCREAGAIVATGHEHSYQRTKTLVSFEQQSVDAGCSNRGSLCVGPGRSFAFVTGLGGNSVRPQLRCLPETYPYGCKGEWAFIYSSNQNATHGALFIDFYVDSDVRKARGYFKNVDQQVVDEFNISKD